MIFIPLDRGRKTVSKTIWQAGSVAKINNILFDFSSRQPGPAECSVQLGLPFVRVSPDLSSFLGRSGTSGGVFYSDPGFSMLLARSL